MRPIACAVLLLLAACAPTIRSKCAGPSECGDTLMCQNAWPQSPPRSCKSDADCKGYLDENRCTSAVMNGRTYEHVCVHVGFCEAPRNMIP
jgi:hypothetical protein